MARVNYRLGKVQFQIMQVLWKLTTANARQITDALNGAGSAAIAHSTVQTLLRELETKGLVDHDQDDRTFVYRALYGEKEITQRATRDFLSQIFNGSSFGLVAHLLEQEELSREELGRLRKLIDDEKG